MVQILKDAAELYAVGSISKEDVVWAVKQHLGIDISFEALPQEFHDYVKECSKEYDSYQHKQKVLEIKNMINSVIERAENVRGLIEDLGLEVSNNLLTKDEAEELLVYGNIVEE